MDNTTPTPLPDESVLPDAQIAALQADLEDAKNSSLRAMADLQNYRKTQVTALDDAKSAGIMQALLAVLPVLDNFQRIAAHMPAEIATTPWAAGVAAVSGQIGSVLQGLGVERIPTEVGMLADPRVHEILGQAAGPEGQVLAVLEEGYMLRGRVLRSSKVQVGGGQR